MYDTASELYNVLLETYFDEYCDLSDAERRKVEHKYKPKSLLLKPYDYNVWLENVELTDKEESTDKESTIKEESVDLSDMPPLEDDEEVKEGNG